MSDEWFYGSRQKRTVSWLPILVAILVLANVALIAYTTVNTNEQLLGVKSQVSTLITSMQEIESQISIANAEISTLQNALKNSSGSGSTTLPASSLIQLYNQTKDSVVLISVTLPTGAAQGSGFVYDTEGRIITNNHVVQDASSITVTFINGTIVKATLVGRDPYSDLAVIKVDVPVGILRPLKLGSSSSLQVGEDVVAIGNPYGLADTLTHGIVSAVERQMDSQGNYPIVDVIQTDAAINPGNSGGPLLNMAGEVVGINTAIPSDTSRGIGFAVPSDTITRELPSLLSKGSYDYPYLGIEGRDVTPDVIAAMNLPAGTHGTLIVSVTSNGPADKAGLKGGTRTATIDGANVSVGGDVITAVDGTSMKNFYDLIVYLQRNKKPGDMITLTILRNNVSSDITVTLGTRPQP